MERAENLSGVVARHFQNTVRIYHSHWGQLYYIAENLLFHHHFTISVIHFHLNIRVGTKKCQDSRLSLNPSNALKGIKFRTTFYPHKQHGQLHERFYTYSEAKVSEKFKKQMVVFCIIFYACPHQISCQCKYAHIAVFVSRHMLGEDLGPLSIKELQQLEKQLEYALSQARQRKV